MLDAAKAFRKNSFDHGQFVTSRFDVLIQFCLNLMGKSKDPLILTGDALDEEELLRVCGENNPVLLMALHVWKHFIAVYLNQDVVAAELATKAERINAKLVPFTFNTHIFLQALASATLSRNSPDYKLRALDQLKKLREFAQHCPENYSHKVYLVEAELAESAGKHDEAMAKYSKSVELAKQHGFIQEEALAHERQGYALRSRGKMEEAKSRFTKARSLYALWGAQIKVDQLAKYVDA